MPSDDFRGYCIGIAEGRIIGETTDRLHKLKSRSAEDGYGFPAHHALRNIHTILGFSKSFLVFTHNFEAKKSIFWAELCCTGKENGHRCLDARPLTLLTLPNRHGFRLPVAASAAFRAGLCPFLGLVHIHCTAAHFDAVQLLDSSRSSLGVHLDESESPRATRHPVDDQFCRLNCTKFTEDGAKLIFRRTERKVSNIKTCCHRHFSYVPHSVFLWTHPK